MENAQTNIPLPAQTTYRLGKASTIILGILCLFLFGIAFTIMWFLVLSPEPGKENVILGLVLGASVTFSGVYLGLHTYKARLDLLPDRFRTQGAFLTRELAYASVAGFKRLEKNTGLGIQPIAGQGKSINASASFANSKELFAWIGENFTDLDAIAYQKAQELAAQEMAAALSDESLGADVEARASKIARALKLAKALNVAAGISMAWAWFYPNPWDWMIYVNAAIPAITLLVALFFRGIMRMHGNPAGGLPSIGFALFGPALVLAVRAVLDVSWLWSPHMAYVTAAFACVVYTLGHFAFRPMQKGWQLPALLLGLGFLYGFGTALPFNVLLDKNPAESYEVSVLDKSESHGKVTTYKVKVTAWGPFQEPVEVEVGSDEYDRYAIGELVYANLQPGAFGLQWYWLERPQQQQEEPGQPATP